MAIDSARARKNGEFDEGKHPRGHGGKFTESGSGGPSTKERMRAGGDLHDRAKASLQDPLFVLQHADRLTKARDEAKLNFPGDKAKSEDALHASLNHMHGEAMRLHLEQEAVGGSQHLQGIVDRERQNAAWGSKGLVEQHEQAMAHLTRARADVDEQRRRDSDAQSRGFPDASAEAAHHEAERQRAAIDNEDAAIAAGHVSGAAREIADRYVAETEVHRQSAEAHADALDRAHHEAADALAALHEYSSDEHERFTLEHATPSLSEGFSEAQQTLHDELGKGEHGDYERESTQREIPAHPDNIAHVEGERYQPYDPEHAESVRSNAPFAHHAGLEHVPHPGEEGEHDLSDEEHARQLAAHEAWAKRAEAVHGEAIDAHHAEFVRRAAVAQTALEQLHEHQVAAHEGLKASNKDAEKARDRARKQIEDIDPEELVNHGAFEHHARDEDDEIVDDNARADRERAFVAAESTVDHATERIEDHSFAATESPGALKESMRSTRDAIKELARITGRAPKLPGKAKKFVTRKGDWDEGKHPRDHGKFSHTAGAQGATTEHGEGGDSEDHEARENEHHAIAAGHVSGAAKEIGDSYMAGHHARQAKLAEHTAALDELHHNAAHALAALHEYSSPHHEDLDFQHHDLHEKFNETQNHLDEERTAEYAHGTHQRDAPIDPDADGYLLPGYKEHPNNIPVDERPTGGEYDRLEAEHDAWHAQATADYKAVFEPHYAEYQRRADTAQTALEALHERQAAAHRDLTEIDHTGEKAHADATRALERIDPEKQVHEAAFAHHARDEEGNIARGEGTDENAADDYAAAHEAAESMHQHASERVEEHTHSDLSDALEALKEETRSTASALKELGGITRRKPRLPAKAKKAAPHPTHAAVVLLRAIHADARLG